MEIVPYHRASHNQVSAHRPLFERVMREDPDRTLQTFVYLEDDMPLTRRLLAAWRADSALLRPFNVYRGFKRVEYRFDTGTPYLIELKGRHVLEEERHFRDRPTLTLGNRTFVNLEDMYAGFWLLERDRLEAFAADAACYHAINDTVEIEQIREKAAYGPQLCHVAGPSAAWSHASVVERIAVTTRTTDDDGGIPLAPSSLIYHAGNNYYTLQFSPGRIVEQFRLLPEAYFPNCRTLHWSGAGIELSEVGEAEAESAAEMEEAQAQAQQAQY